MAAALLAGAALGFGNLMRSEAAMLWCALLAALVLTLTARSEPMKKALVRFALLIAGFVLITAAVRGGIALSGIAPNGTGNSVPEWKLVLGLDTATLGRYDPNMEYLLYIEDGAQRQAAAMEAIRASLSSSEDLFGFFWEKAELFWGGYEESWLGVVNEYIYPLRFWDRVFFIAAALLALVGCFGLRESREETIARGAVFAMFCAYLLIEVQPRYRYFVWPFLLMLAAAGLEGSVKHLSACAHLDIDARRVYNNMSNFAYSQRRDSMSWLTYILPALAAAFVILIAGSGCRFSRTGTCPTTPTRQNHQAAFHL